MRNDESKDSSKVNPADNELGYRNNSASKKIDFQSLQSHFFVLLQWI